MSSVIVLPPVNIKYRKLDQHRSVYRLSRLLLPVTHTEPKQTEIFYFREVAVAPVIQLI